MADSLVPDAPLDTELVRLTERLRARALAALDGEDIVEGVHEARKAGKRLRALIRAVSGPDEAVERIRTIGEGLSAARDADVCRATFAEVFSGEPVPTFTADVDLAAARSAWATVEPVTPGGELLDGLVDGYRRAREAFPGEHADDDAVHRWRRRVKQHRYQLELVAPRWPGPMEAWLAELDTLGDALGKHHDLVVLRAALADDERAAVLTARAAGRLGHARLLGERLFALKPGAIRRLLRACGL